MCVVLSGKIAVSRHDGLGHMSPIVEMGPGEFAAELAELSGLPSPVDVRAEGDVEALIVPPRACGPSSWPRPTWASVSCAR